MKKLWLCLVAVLVMSFSGNAWADNVVALRNKSQVVKMGIRSDGCLEGLFYGVNIKPSQVSVIRFNSERVGWDENSVAVASPVLGTTHLNFTIPSTFNNDEGSWTLVTKKGKIIYLDLRKFIFSGKTHTLITSSKIRYGGYKRSWINLAVDGSCRIRWNVNGVPGVGRVATIGIGGVSEKLITPAMISEVVWNSDIVGWGDNSNIRTILKRDACGNYYAILNGLYNADIGSLAVKLTDGTYSYFEQGAFNYSSNVTLHGSPEWLLEYHNNNPEQPEANVDLSVSGTCSIDWNVNGILGVGQGITPSMVSEVVWNSNLVGWENNSAIRTTLKTDGYGNYYATLTGLYNADIGSLAVKLTDGTYSYFEQGAFNYSSNVTVHGSPDWLLEYHNNNPEQPEPKVDFSTAGICLIDWNVNGVPGISQGVTPTMVSEVVWNSDSVGWGDLSTVRGTLKTDGYGNYYVSLSGLPNSDTGNLSAKLTDGSYDYFDIGAFIYSSNVTIHGSPDWKIEYAR